MLENQTRVQRDAAAFVLPYPNSNRDNVSHLSLGFRNLVIEQNAWVNFLHNRGVQSGSTVVVALPFSPGLIAVCYALFKIGANVVALDPDFNWASGADALVEQKPQHIVGTPSSLSNVRIGSRLNRMLRNKIEVEHPNRFVGSAMRSFRARSTFWGERGLRLTLLKTQGAECSVASFEQSELCRMATCFKDWFALGSGDRCLPGTLLEALLMPAAGLSSVVIGERFSDSSPFAAELVLQFAQSLRLRLVSGDAAFWKAVSRLAGKEKLPSFLSLSAIVTGSERNDCGLNWISEGLPGVAFHLVFGSENHPYIASRLLGDEDELVGAEGFRGVYLGKPLPGVQVSLKPTKDLRWNEEPLAATALGEIALSKQELAPIGDWSCWSETGELGFFDCDGGLWHCGRLREVVSTSFGGFCPTRCEAVFNRHPRVKRSALIGLHKNGKTRPGLVIETEVGEIPKRGVEESRFKAELLQIAKDIEETSLVVDIFFSDRLPIDEGNLDGVDRKRLAKEYSKRIRF